MNELLYYDLKDISGVSLGLAAQVCRELGRRIIAGHLPEGSIIDNETKLCDRYGVSKTVVREAIKILVGKGLLEVRRGSGTRVRRRASWNLLDDDVLAWHQGVDLKPEFLRQLMDVRQMVEPYAAGWAASTASTTQIDEIRKAQIDMESAASVQDFIIADALFHRSILRAANNQLLTALEGVIFSALLGSIKITNDDPLDNSERSIPLHREILKAIETRDSEGAASAMRRHLVDTFNRLSAALPDFNKDTHRQSGELRNAVWEGHNNDAHAGQSSQGETNHDLSNCPTCQRQIQPDK